MNNDKILKVIEELGEMLMNKDNEIKFQKIQIENLNNKIERIESYIRTLESKGA